MVIRHACEMINITELVLNMCHLVVLCIRAPELIHLITENPCLRGSTGTICIYLFFYCMAVQKIKLRASHSTGKRSATWATRLVLLLLVCFSDRVLCFCPSQPSTVILLPPPPKQVGWQCKQPKLTSDAIFWNEGQTWNLSYLDDWFHLRTFLKTWFLGQ
jgi:hypothetical protein